MSVCSLLEVYRENSDVCRSIVLKHFPEDANETDLHNYLEIISKSSVQLVRIPAARCDVAIAVFKDIVFDTRVQKWQENAFRKDFRGCYPTLELLDTPTGIFVTDVPNGVTDELLQLYFDNERSGGIEGTVDKAVEQVIVGTKRYAIIPLTSAEALVSILSQQSHKLSETELEVGPFYPIVHRPILETLKVRDTRNISEILERRETPKYRETVKETLVATLRPEDTVIEHDVMQSAPAPDALLVEQKDVENSQNVQQREGSNKRTRGLAVLPFTRSDHGHLQIIDGSSDLPWQNVAAVKPVVRHKRDESEVLPVTGGEDEKTHTDSTMKLLENVDLPRHKIQLLKSFRFQIKYECETLRINFNEREDTVIFEAASFDKFKAARVQMYKCLDKVIVKAKKLSDHKYTFLSRKPCLSFLRSKCEAENIKVVYEHDNIRREIRCHSFSEKEAIRGLQLLEDEVTVLTINVKPEQKMCLCNSAAWSSLKASIDIDVTTVYLADTEGLIYIESMKDSKATEAKLKITQFLKNDNVSMKLATVTLQSSQARCFQTYIQDQLRQEVMKKDGTLNVIQLSKSPLVLEVSVEGEEAATGVMKKAVRQIWHENVDFNMVSSAAEDIWLIMKGLGGQSGKDFLNKFERNNNCFLEVSEHGDISIPRARVKVENVVDSSDDEPVEESAFAEGDTLDSDSEFDIGATSEVFEKGDNSDRRRNGKGRLSQYQTGLSEQKELEMAMKLSMRSSTDEDLDTRPGGFVRPGRFSDNEEEFVREDDFKRKTKRRECLPEGPQNCEIYSRKVPTSDKDKSYNSELVQPDIKTKSFSLSRTTVTIIQGAVVKQQADALVNVVSASGGLSEGVVSKSFLETGGEELSEMYESAKSSASGVVVATSSSGKLKCSTVLHVQLQKSENCQKIIRQAVSDVLVQCRTWGCKTVAFPTLGCGRMFRFPPKQVAETMLSEICQHLQTKKNNIKQITIAIYDKDVYKEFEAVLEESGKTRKGLVPDEFNAQLEKGSFGTLQKKEVRQRPPSGANHQKRASTGQPQSRHHSARGRWQAPHPRGTRYSSGSSSPSGDSCDRKRPASDQKNRKDNESRKNVKTAQKNRPSRYPVSKPVPKFQVKVVAQNKDMCIQARNAFAKNLKEEFLQEDIIEKKQKISEEAKQKIADIVTSNDIKSIKGKGKYILRGQKGNVQKASSEVLKVLLAEKNSFDSKRKRKANMKRETKEFVEVMVNDEPEVPGYWKNYKPGETLKSVILTAKKFFFGKKFEAVEVKKDSHTYSSIVKMVNSTFDPNLVGKGQDAAGLEGCTYDKLFILKVERIENLHLYEQFTIERQKLYRQLLQADASRFPKLENIPHCRGDVATKKYVRPPLNEDMHPELNESLLFHGTKESNYKIICNDGLDPRLGSGNAMFGVGIYAAECATKADQYADDKNDRTAGTGSPKKMFLIRMVLGNSFLCTDPNPHKFRRPPCTKCYRDDCKDTRHSGGRFGRHFNSVVGDNKKLFREFVVYDRSLCYPEYLITYERR